jgi:hypothetical protein
MEPDFPVAEFGSVADCAVARLVKVNRRVYETSERSEVKLFPRTEK